MKDVDARTELESAVSELIERGLAELEDSVDPSKVANLCKLVVLLSDWADRISLTGHRDPLEMTKHLVLDAAALSHALRAELESAKNLADLGSGVGFPGLPIAILWTQLEVHLVESRRKRHHLQRELRRQLKLTRVNPILGRSDEVEIRKCDVVIAQAMTRPVIALELMRDWVRPGGLVALPASDSAIEPDLPDGFQNLTLREYRVPISGRARKLWVATANDNDH